MALIVIKVRFGETLRRLNVSINAGKLDLNMIMLKEKIRSFFSFGSDVEFTMTYVDEDGDTVTLASDDDLHDVVTQSLNPLRITVNLNSSNFNQPSGNSPQNQHSFQTLNSGFSELWKSVPEPLLEALVKLPLGLASKASSSTPAVAELAEKMKAVYLDPVLSSVASPRVHPTSVGPPNVNSESTTVKKSKVKVNPEAGGSKSKKKEKKVQKVTEGVKFKDVPNSGCESFKGPISTNSEKKDDISSGSLNEPLKRDGPVEPIDQVKQMSQHIHNQMAAQTSCFGRVAAGINNNTNNSGSSSGFTPGLVNAFNQCPFSGKPLTSESDSQGHYCHSQSYHRKKDTLDNNNNSMSSVFHRGVICDGCGIHPITGPRFKSIEKHDYDLCHFCFLGMGNATDYIRMDYPTTALKDHLVHPLRIPPPAVPLHNTMQGSGWNVSHNELDSLFVHDVSVLDGTIMAPFTAFTKTWRIRNSGSINWPYGSQLGWIEGDCLSIILSVDAKIPFAGLPVGKEVDISVDFTAPELPGRYVSYWQMTTPCRKRFGQPVWLIIQVDACKKSLGEIEINLNLPPVTNPKAVHKNHLVYHEMKFPVNDDDNDSVSSTMATISGPLETVCPSVYNSTAVETALGSLQVGLNPISYPEGIFSVMPPASSSAASPPRVVAQPPSGQVRDPVKVLEAMGFTELDMNEEVLRMNNYDLDKAVHELCGYLQWDRTLAELSEMGFADVEANRRLLKKNNGSIKGVVMDLINEEEA